MSFCGWARLPCWVRSFFFFVLFIDNLGWTNSNIQFAKTYTLSYWLVVFLSVWLLRLVVRTYEIVQVKKGQGVTSCRYRGNRSHGP